MSSSIPDPIGLFPNNTLQPPLLPDQLSNITSYSNFPNNFPLNYGQFHTIPGLSLPSFLHSTKNTSTVSLNHFNTTDLSSSPPPDTSDTSHKSPWLSSDISDTSSQPPSLPPDTIETSHKSPWLSSDISNTNSHPSPNTADTSHKSPCLTSNTSDTGSKPSSLDIACNTIHPQVLSLSDNTASSLPIITNQGFRQAPPS